MKHSDILKSRINSIIVLTFYQALIFGAALGYIFLAWQINLSFTFEYTAIPFLLLFVSAIMEIFYRRKKDELREMMN